MSRFYVILCEDLQAQVFVRRTLLDLGARKNDIRIVPYPRGGTGSRTEDRVVSACGSQHVLMNFPAELSATRAQNAKRTAALVVHIDVDNTTRDGRGVSDRHRELDRACADASVAPRTSGDPVALLVPRRNIETWIKHLLTLASVDEYTSYPKLTAREADAGPAAERFARHVANQEPIAANAPPSLVAGIKELRGVV